MARKKKKAEHVNHERWLVSYADFITLLFAFFVVMYALAMQDKIKAKAVIDAIAATFRAEAMGHAKPAGKDNARSDAPEDLQTMANAIEEAINFGSDPQVVAEQMRIRFDDRGMVIHLSVTNFFEPAHVDVRKEALPYLEKIAKVLKTTDRLIRVEGHTDNTPIESEDYPTNWELSAGRATWVVRYLVKNFKLDPAKLSAAGFAQFHPLASNDDESGRKQNRRIEIVVLAGDHTSAH